MAKEDSVTLVYPVFACLLNYATYTTLAMLLNYRLKFHSTQATW